MLSVFYCYDIPLCDLRGYNSGSSSDYNEHLKKRNRLNPQNVLDSNLISKNKKLSNIVQFFICFLNEHFIVPSIV